MCDGLNLPLSEVLAIGPVEEQGKYMTYQVVLKHRETKNQLLSNDFRTFRGGKVKIRPLVGKPELYIDIMWLPYYCSNKNLIERLSEYGAVRVMPQKGIPNMPPEIFSMTRTFQLDLKDHCVAEDIPCYLEIDDEFDPDQRHRVLVNVSSLKRCHKCQGKGHIIKNCTAGSCTNCGSNRHTTVGCPNPVSVSLGNDAINEVQSNETSKADETSPPNAANPKPPEGQETASTAGVEKVSTAREEEDLDKSEILSNKTASLLNDSRDISADFPDTDDDAESVGFTQGTHDPLMSALPDSGDEAGEVDVSMNVDADDLKRRQENALIDDNPTKRPKPAEPKADEGRDKPLPDPPAPPGSGNVSKQISKPTTKKGAPPKAKKGAAGGDLWADEIFQEKQDQRDARVTQRANDILFIKEVRGQLKQQQQDKARIKDGIGQSSVAKLRASKRKYLFSL